MESQFSQMRKDAKMLMVISNPTIDCFSMVSFFISTVTPLFVSLDFKKHHNTLFLNVFHKVCHVKLEAAK